MRHKILFTREHNENADSAMDPVRVYDPAADLERGRVRAAQSAEAGRLAAYRAVHAAAPPEDDDAWECKRNAWALCED